MTPNIRRALARGGLAGLLLSACGVNSPDRHFLLAEKLWTEKKYAAAVSEFEKARKKDAQGELGFKALYRAATTQAVFLQEYPEAIDKLREFLKDPRAQTEHEMAMVARELIGEILYSKLRHFDQAMGFYEDLLRDPLLPTQIGKDEQGQEKLAEWNYRVAKSAAESYRFDLARNHFERLRTEFPKTSQAERALFELGQLYFTAGEQRAEQLGLIDPKTGKGDEKDVFRKAIKHYEAYLKNYPRGDRRQEAWFGIASCYEELDQLDEALVKYQALIESYPAPGVIQIKIARLTERIKQRASHQAGKKQGGGKKRL